MKTSTMLRLLAVFALVLLFGLLAGPLVLLLRVSCFESAGGIGFFREQTWTLQHYYAWLHPANHRLLAASLGFAAAVMVGALLLAYPLAWALTMARERTQRWIVGLVLLPKCVSVLLVLFGLQQLLGPRGPLRWLGIEAPLRSWWAAWVAEVLLVWPIVWLLLWLELRRIDPCWWDVARGLGATRWRAFREVTWPMSLPMLLLCAAFAWVWGLSAFLGPMLLGRTQDATLAGEVIRQALEYGRWPVAAAGAVVLLLLMLLGSVALTRLRRIL